MRYEDLTPQEFRFRVEDVARAVLGLTEPQRTYQLTLIQHANPAFYAAVREEIEAVRAGRARP